MKEAWGSGGAGQMGQPMPEVCTQQMRPAGVDTGKLGFSCSTTQVMGQSSELPFMTGGEEGH